MKILAFAASNSRNSINRALVEHATSRLQAEVIPRAESEFPDLNDYEIPIYSIDCERESGIPAKAQSFFDKIGGADAVLVLFAEHDGSVTAAWKNIFDCMGRIDMRLWQGKPLVMTAAIPGPRACAGVLGSQEMIAPYIGAEIRGKLGVGRWSEVRRTDTRALTRTEDIVALGNVMDGLAPQSAGEELAQ